jgi:hypothetical protein
VNYELMQDKLKKLSIISPEYFDQALRKYNIPEIDFTRILLPGETIDKWMVEFKEANKGGYLIRYVREGMHSNDYALWAGSAKGAVMNQNIINIYDALKNGTTPKVIDPDIFLNALKSKIK